MRREQALDILLKLAHGKRVLNGKVRRFPPQLFVGDREKRSRVSRRKRARLNHGAQVVGKREQAQGVCNSRTGPSDAVRDLLLGQAEGVDQRLIAACLLNGIEVLALQVLNQRELRRLQVVRLKDLAGISVNPPDGERASGAPRR